MNDVDGTGTADFALVVLAGSITAVFWSIVLTFPEFFLFDPFAAPSALRRVELVVSTFGWVVLSTVPSVMIALYAGGRRRAIDRMPFAALLWPVSLVVSQVTVYAQSGWWYVGYLADYPVFVFTDVILPLTLVLLWARLRSRPSVLPATG